jgi:hypothetical protein
VPTLGSDGGGNGWGDDDPGDDWGWSEGPDGDEDATPYRRSRIVRAVALVTVAAVVTGSIGTWVAIIAVGSPQSSYAVSAIHARVAPAEQKSPTGHPSVSVSFIVSNDSALTGRASCRAVISAGGSTAVGSAVANTARLPGGSSMPMTIRVALNAGTLAGNGPAGVQVGCTPMSTQPG